MAISTKPTNRNTLPALQLFTSAVLLVVAGAVTDEKTLVRSDIVTSMAAVNQATFQAQSIFNTKSFNLTKLQKMGLKDCMLMFDDAVAQLESAQYLINSYDKTANSKVISNNADDIKTWLSAAITNQEQCLDALIEDGIPSPLTETMKVNVQKVSSLCSHALAAVIRMMDADLEEKLASERKSRKLLSDDLGFPARMTDNVIGEKTSSEKKRKRLADDLGFPALMTDDIIGEKTSSEKKRKRPADDMWFPRWMTLTDRRLLQGDVAANVVVAADGTGDYETVAAAVAAAPSKRGRRYVIRIKAGTYKENVNVPRSKTNLMFVGDGVGVTVISGSSNVVDGVTTFRSATVAIVGNGFLARDLTIENTAGPSKGQAVALRVGSDKSAFYRCEIKGYQDTLYVYTQRQFYRDCTISGTVDFIFGNAAAVLQNCNIQIRNPNPGQKNTITAQGRTDPNQNTGISIQGCTITGATSAKSYLGRPWKRFSRTMVMQSSISSVIDPAGWLPWSGTFALDTLTYLEYQNTGPGSGTGNRVNWKGFQVITEATDAEPYTAGSFIGGGSWLGDTGFPFSLGL